MERCKNEVAPPFRQPKSEGKYSPLMLFYGVKFVRQD